MYQLPNALFDMPGVRSAATRAVQLTVANNVSHPSVFAWSLVNEPASSRPELGQIGPGLQTYIREAAAAARQIDDTRLIAIDRQSRIGEPLWSPAYRYLDALGVNEYFGWYDSVRADLPGSSTTERARAVPGRAPPRRTRHSPWSSPSSAPRRPVTGPATQRGTYEFQTRYAIAHLRIHASKRLRGRLDRVGAARLQGRGRLAGRRPARVRDRPLEQQEPDRADEPEEARVLRAAQALAAHEAARLSGPLRCAAVKALLSLAALGVARARRMLAQLGQRVVRRQRRRQARRRDRMPHQARVSRRASRARRRSPSTTPGPGPRIVFYLTSGQAEAAQFEGQGEGAEQIGSALLFVRDGTDDELEKIERCLNDL